MIAAPPFAAYSTMNEAIVPSTEWPYLYASLQAFKAHVQEYPGCQKLEAFVDLGGSGAVRVNCYTVWDTPEQLEAFLERGYTFERMLRGVANLPAEPTRVMEKVF